MSNYEEPSSSLSFTSSSYVSNGTSTYNVPTSTGTENGGSSPEIISLNRLSLNLERLLVDTEFDCSDTDIVVEGISVGVHRCILSARSKFFHDLFVKERNESSRQEGKPKYDMNNLVPYGRVGHESFVIFLSYVYTGKLKPSPPEVSTCVDTACTHDACRPAVDSAVELMYASYVFQIAELVSLFQRRLLNFVEKALVEDVIPIIRVAFHCQLHQLLEHCIRRLTRSDLDYISLEKELPHEVVDEIKTRRLPSQTDEPDEQTADPVHEKRIRRILMALDSDDIELVKLLLTESDITLDDAFALHYAAAYCDSKIVSEVLELGLTNVNLKNARGYSVLHVAAMRREPAVIVALLSKGANALEPTADGQSAVRICRRLTRSKDYHVKTEQGQESNKYRVCIDLLEREMWRNPMDGDESILSPVMADDLHMKLLYLENRVAFARLLFPTEAKVAMQIANTETTSEFAGLSAPKICGSLREVDLNETPSVQNKRLRSRMDALSKTVELGRRFFPRCSEVLDKFLEDDLPDLFYLEKGTPNEQKIKRMRFCELKADFQKAFTKDKEFSRSGFSSSSSSSSSLRDTAKNKISKK